MGKLRSLFVSVSASALCPFCSPVSLTLTLCAEGGDPPIEDILSSQLGFAYFHEHLKREYAEENLICVQAGSLSTSLYISVSLCLLFIFFLSFMFVRCCRVWTCFPSGPRSSAFATSSSATCSRARRWKLTSLTTHGSLICLFCGLFVILLRFCWVSV